MIRKNKLVAIGLLICLIALSLVGFKIYSKFNKENLANNTEIKTEDKAEDNINDENEKIIEETIDEDNSIENNVNEILNKMSLEEKVGQLFVVTLEDINNGYDGISFNDTMKENLDKYNIGGVIFFQKNIIDRDQVTSLIDNLQKESKMPLFISVDEEGGIVSRIGSNPNMNTTEFEDMLEVGNSEDYDRAYEIGSTIGREIHELGFNLDFAPVADVLTNSENSEIGVRSFGSDPELVSKMVINYANGLQDNNVAATLKHFPGHGNTLENSHYGTSYTLRTLEEIKEVELLPFKAGIENGIDFILVSHLSAPNITGDDTPASLSSVIINDLLRDYLNYDGIVTTDALNMGAVSLNYYPAEAAIKAINSGVDILLMSPDFEGVYNEVINSVNNGSISEERINESVRRILKVKLSRKIIN